MKVSEINQFINHLKSINKNRLYISEEFIDWYSNFKNILEDDTVDVFYKNQKKIKKKVRDYISNCDSKFIIPEFIFDEYDNDVLKSSKFLVDKKDQNDLRHKIKWRNKVSELLKKIDIK